MINIKVGKKLSIKETTGYVDVEYLRTAINFLQDTLTKIEEHQDSLIFEDDVATKEEATRGVDTHRFTTPKHMCEMLDQIYLKTNDRVKLGEPIPSFNDPNASVRDMFLKDEENPHDLKEDVVTDTPKPRPLVFHHYITDFSNIDVNNALNEVVNGNEVPVDTGCFKLPTQDFVEKYRSELAPIWWVCIILQHSKGIKIIAPGEKFEYTVNNAGQIVLT
tara:strand:- start:1791 stop:2447 length:657 start_codon:yes stop_codon:yes gene_type:complete